MSPRRRVGVVKELLQSTTPSFIITPERRLNLPPYPPPSNYHLPQTHSALTDLFISF